MSYFCIIVCVSSKFNLSRFYFKSVLEDKSYIILNLYHYFLHKATLKFLVKFFYQSTLLFQCSDEPLEQLLLCFLAFIRLKFCLSYPVCHSCTPPYRLHTCFPIPSSIFDTAKLPSHWH